MTHLLTQGPRYKANQPTPKGIWFDVDNTLVDNNSATSPSKRFLDAAKKAGSSAHIGLATARPLQKVAHIIKAANLTGLSILSNGAQIYDGATGTMAAEYTLSVAETLQIARTLQLLGIRHWIQDDGNDHFWLETTAGEQAEDLGAYSTAKDVWRPAEGDNKQIIDTYIPVKPFVIVADDATEDDVETIASVVKDITNITSLVAHQVPRSDGSISYKVFILDVRANKHDALLKVTEMLGLKREETMAVGDGPNDTVIVENAGIGIALANAVEQTKQVATYLAPSMADDGAAIALEELVLG